MPLLEFIRYFSHGWILIICSKTAYRRCAFTLFSIHTYTDTYFFLFLLGALCACLMCGYRGDSAHMEVRGQLSQIIYLLLFTCVSGIEFELPGLHGKLSHLTSP